VVLAFFFLKFTWPSITGQPEHFEKKSTTNHSPLDFSLTGRHERKPALQIFRDHPVGGNIDSTYLSSTAGFL